MSDTSQGDGWWQASDGKWYGPDERPETNAMPPPPSQASPIEETATPAGPNRPWWKKKRFAIPLGFVIVTVIIAALSPAEDEGGNTTAESPATTTTESQEPADTTTTETPATTTTTVAAPEVCDVSGVTFETAAGVSCEAVYEQTHEVLVESGEDWGGPDSPAVQIQAATVCSVIAGDETKTYEPESAYIPALANSLAGAFCPGDPALLVLNQ